MVPMAGFDSGAAGVRVEADDPRDPTPWAVLLDHRPSAWLRRVPGRETFPWTAPDGREFVVKRSGPEPLLQRLRDDWRRCLGGRRPRTPARRERDALRDLAGLGVRVPRPLALVEELEGRGRSLVVMEFVPHELTLRERCPGPDLRRALLELVVRMHRAGRHHRDLYLQHLVLDRRRPGPAGLTLLDCGRVRHGRPLRRRWLEKDLAALALWWPHDLPRTSCLRLLVGWCRAMGVVGRGRRRLLHAVERRRRRMARHVPLHGEPPGSPRPALAARRPEVAGSGT